MSCAPEWRSNRAPAIGADAEALGNELLGLAGREQHRLVSLPVGRADPGPAANEDWIFLICLRVITAGEQARDHVFVRDVVGCTIAAAANRARSGVYNVGTGKTTTFNQIIAALNEALGDCGTNAISAGWAAKPRSTASPDVQRS